MHSTNRYLYRASKQHSGMYRGRANSTMHSINRYVTHTGRANNILYASTAVTYNILQVWSGVFQGFTDVSFQKASNKQHAKNNQDQREHTSKSKVPYKPSDISVTPITLYTAWHSKNNAVFRKPYLFQGCASRNIKQWDGWSSAVNWTIP